jgi:transcriptional regulator GlxA family with amidase domain
MQLQDRMLKELDSTIDVREGVRFVDDGDVITSAGVSAGIDTALQLVG